MDQDANFAASDAHWPLRLPLSDALERLMRIQAFGRVQDCQQLHSADWFLLRDALGFGSVLRHRLAPEVEFAISVASIWKIATKARLGKRPRPKV
jgi:hypothetical protein